MWHSSNSDRVPSWTSQSLLEIEPKDLLHKKLNANSSATAALSPLNSPGKWVEGIARIYIYDLKQVTDISKNKNHTPTTFRLKYSLQPICITVSISTSLWAGSIGICMVQWLEGQTIITEGRNSIPNHRNKYLQYIQVAHSWAKSEPVLASYVPQIWT